MINNFLKKVIEFLEQSATIFKKYYLWIIISASILSLVVAGLMFYKYIWLVMKTEPEFQSRRIQINENTFNTILENINQREKRFLEAKDKIFPNIFK